MTSKLVVNTIEADTGISSVSFASSISMDSTSKFHFSAAGIDIGADTNINRPAAGVLGFNINDGEKVRIKSDGKVGIGTNLSSSTYKLEVWDDSAATFMIRKGNTSRIVLSNDSTSNTLYSQTISGYAARDFSVRIGQSEAIRINSSGNIGIATDISGVGGAYGRLSVVIPSQSGGSALQVMNSAVGSGDGSLTNIVLRSVNNLGTQWAGAEYRAQEHIFKNQATEAVRITSTGVLRMSQSGTNTNVLANDTGGPNIWLRNTSNTDGNYSKIGFFNSTDYITAFIAAQYQDAGDRNTDLVFGTRANGGALAEALRIKSGGQVNIGGDYDQTAYSLSVTNTAGNLFRIKTANEGDYDLRFMVQNSESNIWHYGTDDFVFGNRYDRKLHFITNGSKRLTIHGNYVGINNTSPANALDVTGDLVVRSSLAKIGLIDTDGGDQYQIRNDAGSFIIRNATDSQSALTIDGGGNVTTVKNVRVNISNACDGIIGEAYSGYFGLKHADQTINSEYMIISNDTHTYISSSAGSNIYLRPGANNSDHETLFAQNTTTFKTHILFSSGHFLQRSNHHTGHLVGSYNNVGANSQKSNPIYTIGSSYNPGDNDLGNMYGIGYSHGNNAPFISFSGLTGWGMYVAADGDCRIFLDATSGKIASTGTITQNASDVRLKTNIKVIDNPIEKIKKIRGVTFDWIDNITTEYDFHPDSMHETGVIAQEIQEVIPDAVTTAPFNGNYTKKSGTDNNFLTVKNEKIIPLCIEAIKELSAQVELLKSKVATLEGS